MARERAYGNEAEEKLAWVSQVLRDWGSCGRLLLVDDRLVGHVIYAPAVFVPGAGEFPTSPVSGDAVVMASLRVAEPYAGRGAGRRLLPAMAKDLIKRGDIRAVEAFAGTGPCLLPVDFLKAVGFRTVRAHPRTPRMRMELRSLVTWRTDLEEALDRLRGVLPNREPVPAAERWMHGTRLSRQTRRRGVAAH